MNIKMKNFLLTDPPSSYKGVDIIVQSMISY